MLNIETVKKHPGVKACIKKSEQYLNSLGFTDHGSRHLGVVSDRARSLAKKIGLNERGQELATIAGYCHDMGNFLHRKGHCYTGAMLFGQFFWNSTEKKEEILEVMQAIANHDESDYEIINKIGAVLILADKSDVHRSRVRNKDLKSIQEDIHDRVNYSVVDSSFSLNDKKKEVVLKLKIDTKITGAMEYFEIFNDRMIACRRAAKYLGYGFVLVINNFKLD